MRSILVQTAFCAFHAGPLPRFAAHFHGGQFFPVSVFQAVDLESEQNKTAWTQNVVSHFRSLKTPLRWTDHRYKDTFW